MTQESSSSDQPVRADTHPFNNRGFSRTFAPGRMTIGFITPLEGYPDAPWPTMRNHTEMVVKAEQAGVSAIWLRDVPFYDPSFGDVGQLLDPMVYAGYLAAVTSKIAIGTAGIVAPLREPIYVAKASASIDHITGNRFMLGLAAGDRPGEYPAFGVPYPERSSRFRESLDIIRATTEDAFGTHRSAHYGTLNGSMDLVPKPVNGRLPTVSIGRAGQTLEWLAANMDAWVTSGFDIRTIADVVPEWRALSPSQFKPYGYGCWFDLTEDPDVPVHFGRVSIRGGRKAMIELFYKQQEAGVSHVILNMKPTRRDPREVLDELGEHVLPLFPPNHDS